MAIKASRRALEVANLAPDQLGLVILATATPDHLMPNTATMVQTALGATGAGDDRGSLGEVGKGV